MICAHCKEDKSEDRFNLEVRGEICFGCHVKGVSLGFTHGKNTFHGPTFGELTRQAYKDAERTGEKIIPRTTTSTVVGTAGQMAKLGATMNGATSNG